MKAEEIAAKGVKPASHKSIKQLGGGQYRRLGEVCRSGAPALAEGGPVCEELDCISSTSLLDLYGVSTKKILINQERNGALSDAQLQIAFAMEIVS